MDHDTRHAMIMAASAPVTSAGIGEHVREALGRREPLRIAGRAQWLDAGRPARAVSMLSLRALSGIVDYTPGDLTLTARAGTTLEEIARVTASERQWLALDPFGPPTGTIGATVATASSGPLAHGFGTPRDNVLGLEIVTGDGRTIRSGGRVVKNVAGFDLTRLFTGSWGTLGVITEITVRLRALPERDETLALLVDDDQSPLDALLARLRSAAIEPLAMELVNAALARQLNVADHAALLVRLGGNAERVRAQRGLLASLGDTAATPAAVWTALRECEPAGAMVMRWSMLPSRTAECWAGARAATAGTENAPTTLMHASPERGIVRCIVPGSRAEFRRRTMAAAAAFGGTAIFERLPVQDWPRVPVAAGGRLSQRVRQEFDPHALLNPGILGAPS